MIKIILKYIGIPLGLFVILFTSYCYLVLAYAETVFHPYPEIDTQFTKSFSISAFELISPGMTAAQVSNILGEPFTNQDGFTNQCWDGKTVKMFNLKEISNRNQLIETPLDGAKIWSYSKDGANSWFDFAWLEYRVQFQNGIVVKKESCWHGD